MKVWQTEREYTQQVATGWESTLQLLQELSGGPKHIICCYNFLSCAPEPYQANPELVAVIFYHSMLMAEHAILSSK